MISSKLLGITTILYLLCMAGNFAYLFFRGRKFHSALMGLAVVSFAAHTGGLGFRWYESYAAGYGHIPLANFYESLVSLSWTTMIIFFVIELRYKVKLMGALIFPIISLAMAYASLSPNVQSEITPLMPALQSNWLTYHVITCFLAYSSFAVSFVTSIVYMFKAGKVQAGGQQPVKSTDVIPSLEAIDEIIYKTIAIGFLLLTVGIITGSVWANYAWGSYWGWDPKETWSLITWFIYAAFLHARLTRDWRGKRAAMISIAGFVCVLFTFLGVNLLLSGLHSYAS